MNMSMKEIRECAEEIGKITNADGLREAVPFLVAASKRLNDLASTMKQVRKAVEDLGKKASAYALAHPSCFDGGKLDTSPVGVRSGDITIGGSVYHFASGFGPVVRADGDPLTQDYLLGLPKDWTKADVKLDMTAIMGMFGKGGQLCEELGKKGLVRSVKNQWGIKVEAATVEGCDE